MERTDEEITNRCFQKLFWEQSGGKWTPEIEAQYWAEVDRSKALCTVKKSVM